MNERARLLNDQRIAEELQLQQKYKTLCERRDAAIALTNRQSATLQSMNKYLQDAEVPKFLLWV